MLFWQGLIGSSIILLIQARWITLEAVCVCIVEMLNVGAMFDSVIDLNTYF
jgi:hypothetical protein